MSAAGDAMRDVCDAVRRSPPSKGEWRMFYCQRWIDTEGNCCPDGTVHDDCPGLMAWRGKETEQ